MQMAASAGAWRRMPADEAIGGLAPAPAARVGVVAEQVLPASTSARLMLKWAPEPHASVYGLGMKVARALPAWRSASPSAGIG